MAEEEGKQEEKFDFTAEGEALGYISLAQARVLAIRHARDNPEFYGERYSGIRLVWEVTSEEDWDDFYEIRLSFRPAGRFRGEPGVEQLIIDKTGNIEIRQMQDEPTGLDLPELSAATPHPDTEETSPDTSTSTPPTVPRLPQPSATSVTERPDGPTYVEPTGPGQQVGRSSRWLTLPSGAVGKVVDIVEDLHVRLNLRLGAVGLSLGVVIVVAFVVINNIFNPIYGTPTAAVLPSTETPVRPTMATSLPTPNLNQYQGGMCIAGVLTTTERTPRHFILPLGPN